MFVQINVLFEPQSTLTKEVVCVRLFVTNDFVSRQRDFLLRHLKYVNVVGDLGNLIPHVGGGGESFH